MKLYDAQMRSLLDRYIVAPRSEKLAELNDFSFLDIININVNNENAIIFKTPIISIIKYNKLVL